MAAERRKRWLRVAATGLGGMRGQHRLDFEEVEAFLNFCRRNLRPLQLPEQTAQRLGGVRRRLEVANPGAFLAEIHQLEEKAEGVCHLVCLRRLQAGHHSALGPNDLSLLVFSDLLGQEAELLDPRVESSACLFSDDAAQARGEMADLCFELGFHNGISCWQS